VTAGFWGCGDSGASDSATRGSGRRAAERGDNLGTITAALLRLLDRRASSAVDAIFSIFGASDRDKRLILQS
jgi:hypothetical protein